MQRYWFLLSPGGAIPPGSRPTPEGLAGLLEGDGNIDIQSNESTSKKINPMDFKSVYSSTSVEDHLTNSGKKEIKNLVTNIRLRHNK